MISIKEDGSNKGPNEKFLFPHFIKGFCESYVHFLENLLTKIDENVEIRAKMQNELLL